MSGWGDLAMHGVRVLPWDGAAPKQGHTWDRFGATFTTTINLLRRELDHLHARNLVVELDIRDYDIRVDGLPRANARPVGHPGVRVDFESKFGPVRMETCEFTKWEANLRAIALSLEALRKVDRYGVSKRGEQYRGWRAIPMSTDAADQIQTVEQARTLLDGYGGLTAALKATHPDRGGDADEFRRVIRAKELIEA